MSLQPLEDECEISFCLQLSGREYDRLVPHFLLKKCLKAEFTVEYKLGDKSRSRFVARVDSLGFDGAFDGLDESEIAKKILCTDQCSTMLAQKPISNKSVEEESRERNIEPTFNYKPIAEQNIEQNIEQSRERTKPIAEQSRERTQYSIPTSTLDYEPVKLLDKFFWTGNMSVERSRKRTIFADLLYVYDHDASFESNTTYPRVLKFSQSRERPDTEDPASVIARAENVSQLEKLFFVEDGIRVSLKTRHTKTVVRFLEIELEYDTHENFVKGCERIRSRSTDALRTRITETSTLRSATEIARTVLDSKNISENISSSKNISENISSSKNISENISSEEKFFSLVSEMVSKVQRGKVLSGREMNVYTVPKKPFSLDRGGRTIFEKIKWDGVQLLGALYAGKLMLSNNERLPYSGRALKQNFLYQFEQLRDDSGRDRYVLTEVLQVRNDLRHPFPEHFGNSSAAFRSGSDSVNNVLVQDSALIIREMAAACEQRERLCSHTRPMPVDCGIFISEPLPPSQETIYCDHCDGKLLFDGDKYFKVKRRDTVEMILSSRTEATNKTASNSRAGGTTILKSLESTYIGKVKGYSVLLPAPDDDSTAFTNDSTPTERLAELEVNKSERRLEFKRFRNDKSKPDSDNKIARLLE